jgi:hypothetical protein
MDRVDELIESLRDSTKRLGVIEKTVAPESVQCDVHEARLALQNAYFFICGVRVASRGQDVRLRGGKVLGDSDV